MVGQAGGVKGLCEQLDGIRFDLEHNKIVLDMTPACQLHDKSICNNSTASGAPIPKDPALQGSSALLKPNIQLCDVKAKSLPAMAPMASALDFQDGVVTTAAMSRDLLATIRACKNVRVLEVGSGDGSHPLSFVNDLPDARNLVVTCYDSRAEAEQKYPAIDGPSAAQNFQDLEVLGVRLVFGVDATQLSVHDLGKFDVAMFYFPHSGVPNSKGEECVQSNRNLISGFLKSVPDVMAEGGEVHVALKTTAFYAAWNIEELISCAGMKKTHDFELNREEFPEYAHRLTLGSNKHAQVHDRGARVYLCEPGESVDRTAGVRRICDTSVRLRITCIDTETDAEVGAAVLSLLQDSTAPQNVLEIRSSMQNRHDTRQLNRVLTQLVDAGHITKIASEAGKPTYMVSDTSSPHSMNILETDTLRARIMELLANESVPLDTLQVAKAVGLTVQKDVRPVLQQLLGRGAVEQKFVGSSARPHWRLTSA